MKKPASRRRVAVAGYIAAVACAAALPVLGTASPASADPQASGQETDAAPSWLIMDTVTKVVYPPLLAMMESHVAVESVPARETDFLRNWQTGECLDSNQYGQVYANPCQTGNQYQQWTINVQGTVEGHDHATFQNVATGLYLDSDGSALRTVDAPTETSTWRGNGPSWQEVTLEAKSGSVDGCLDTDGARSAFMQPCGSSGAQDWRFGY